MKSTLANLIEENLNQVWSVHNPEYRLNIIKNSYERKPEDIAKVAVFLASDEAACISGERKSVSGWIYS